MLNLKKLEKELDDALAKETPESLRTWLLEERNKELNEQIHLANFKAHTLYEFANMNYTVVTPSIDLSWLGSLINSIDSIHSKDQFYSPFYSIIKVNDGDILYSAVAPLTKLLKSTKEESQDNNYALAA